ncbi:MAG TPA: pilus assembly protein PilP [Burkholderiales bacterium]|nr:pilus assembly protein PilP [Burkholderiales bacterium]
MRALRAMAVCVLLLAGCGGDQFSDLKQFVKESGEGLRGRVEPIPEVKQFEPFAYNAFDLPDPFKPRTTIADNRTLAGGGPQPDLNRRKEALEAFPLESLQMVGTLEQKRIYYALIKTPDKNLYRVKVGNYVGQNFGVITAISDSAVTLKEVIQDSSSGSWTERTSNLQLLEQ